MRRTKTSLIGAAILLLLNGIALAVVPYPFFDGFETGSYSPNWTAGSGSVTRQVTSAMAASGAYSLTIIGGSTTTGNGLNASFQDPQAPQVISYSVRVSSTTSDAGYVVLNSGSYYPIYSYMTSNGYIRVNGELTYPYQANTWYHFRFQIDWTNGQIDYYINEVLIKSNVAFATQTSSFTTIMLYNYTSGSQAWWDNIDIGGSGGPVIPPRIIKDGWELMTTRYNGLETYGASHPALADLDNDGDRDLVLGDGSGQLWYYRNNGQGSFSRGDTCLAVVQVGGAGAPALGDLDGDGDLDLLVGKADGTLSFYRNDGSASSPVFGLVDSNYFGLDVGSNSCPVFIDLDGDNDLDLLVGKADGTLSHYRNSGTAQSAYWALADAYYDSIDIGTNSTPSLVDLDNDGDPDLLVGKADGTLAFYRNDGTALNPAWSLVDNSYFFIDAGTYSSPAWVDLDSDGDFDLLMGEASGGLVLFRNQGTAASAYFAGQSAFNFALSAGPYSAPCLADLDGDGDLDLLVGGQDGALRQYRNDGTAALASWSLVDSAFLDLDVGTYGQPALADIDGDNDLDLFVGKYDGTVSFYRNDGTVLTPAYTLVDSHYYNIDVGSYSAPCLTDLDNDGDRDLFIGNAGGTIYYYRNTGSAGSPYFSLESTFFDSIDVGSNSVPAFADLDKNGVLDLFVGSSNGQVALWYNNGTAQAADLVYITAFYAELSAGTYSAPAFGDLDGDGDLDLLLGRADGYLTHYRNVSAGTAPIWGQISVSFLSIDAGSNSVPVWADIDGDNDLDLFVGNYSGTVWYYLNKGTALAPVCTLITTQYNTIDKGSYSVPVFADLDGDGDLDLLVGAYDGTISLYRNDGTRLNPSWSLLDSNYFNIDVGSYSAPAPVDIDGDNDLDLFVGNSAGYLYFYRNEGTAQAPYWRQESVNFLGSSVGSNSVPAFHDLDGDGDLDLLVGELDGNLNYYRNDSTARVPRFVLETAAFNGIDIGSNSAPTLADIDGDGDIGLFIGNSAGTITYWEMITPTVGIEKTAQEDRTPAARAFRIVPNPVRGQAWIILPDAAEHSVTIYDRQGAVINILKVNGQRVVVWDGTDAAGQPAAPGIYYVRAGETVQKIIVIE